RTSSVTGVQTCALPILLPLLRWKANCLLRCGHGFSSSSLISTGGKFGASACWWSAACWQSALSSSSISISRDSAPVPCIDSIIHSMQHPPLQRELSFAIPTLNYVFCFLFFLLSKGCNFQCSEVQYFSQNLLK